MKNPDAVVLCFFLGVFITFIGAFISNFADTYKLRRVGWILLAIGVFHMLPGIFYLWTSILLG